MTVTGHEEEFRRLFEQEAGTRLSSLAEGALELETGGGDPELVAQMFRDAHTLKGGAAVVGFDEVASVVHELEQLLEELRSRTRAADAALVDGVLVVVDAVREMVARAMQGADAGAAAATALGAVAAVRGGRSAGRRPAASREPPGDAAAGPPAQAAHAGAADEDAAADDAPGDPASAEAPPATEPVVAPDPVVAAPPARPAGGPAATAAPASPSPALAGGDAIPVPVRRLDELVRLVGESATALLRVGALLAERLGDDPGAVDEYRELSRVLHHLQERTMRARMVSVGTVAAPLRRAVRDIARSSGKEVRWELAGEDTELDRHVLERLREPLVALVRNAADHGVEAPDERVASGKPAEATVRLQALQVGSEVVIEVSDDGRGIDVDRVRARAGRPLTDAGAVDAIFEPGLTTAPAVSGVSGRGVGLDAVRSAVDALRGRVEVRTAAGRGTAFRISVPMTLAVMRCLLVRAGGRRYALPLHSTAAAIPMPADPPLSAEGGPVLLVDGEPIGVAELAGVLGLPEGTDHPTGRAARAAVVLATASGRQALAVDELVSERDVVVKDLGGVLPRLALVAGASVEPDGGVMLVLDADGLVRAARDAPPAPPPAAAPRPAPARILVVDDALTIRELQKSILRRAGYDVEAAPDGEAALRALATRPADLVVSDVEMPRMDGYTLTRAIRAAPALASTPVLVLTSRDAEEDRRRGLEAGADAYLAKGDFDERTLLAAVRRLLGDGPPADDREAAG